MLGNFTQQPLKGQHFRGLLVATDDIVRLLYISGGRRTLMGCFRCLLLPRGLSSGEAAISATASAVSSNRVEQGMGKKILKHTFITSRKRERPSPSSERVREEGKMGGREETIYKKVAGLIFSHSTTNFRTVIIVPTEQSGLDWTRLGRQRRRQAEWRKAAQWKPDQ